MRLLIIYSFYILNIVSNNNILAQETEILNSDEIKVSNDSIPIEVTYSRNVDSINSTTKIYTITKEGNTEKLIQIDNTNSIQKIELKIYVIALISLLILGVILYYFKFKKRNTSKCNLTKQEKNIVNLINSDKTNLEISEELFISKSTVKTHINNIYRKLNISSRIELKNISNIKENKGLDP